MVTSPFLKHPAECKTREMSGAAKTVCVTGASGYVASWLVKLLLHRGYTVKATVRTHDDPTKVDHLKALEGAEERLHLFQANLLEDGSFDSIVEGCEGVFHTASPCFFLASDPQAELIEPAVKGTLNVLRSCSKVPSVRRVVLTSSISAVLGSPNPKGPDVVIDETWFSEPEYCTGIEQWYRIAKTLAEKAAWEFAEQNGMDLVVLLPGLMLGPLLQPTLNFSSQIIASIVKGETESPVYHFVDVRDVANAHLAAFENPSASGRYILIESVQTLSETMKVLHKLYPSISAPPTTGTEKPPYQVSKKKAESLGISFTPIEVSFRDTIESLKEKHFLTL